MRTPQPSDAHRCLWRPTSAPSTLTHGLDAIYSIVDLTTPDPNSPRDLGWLLECQLVNADGASADTLRALVTDMRLVGLEPVIFVAQPPVRLTRA
jgi:hypothetical protein